MPRRVTLTDRQREALLHLPVDQGGVSSGRGRNDTLSAASANQAATARRTPNAFITRRSVPSVGLPLSLNAL